MARRHGRERSAAANVPCGMSSVRQAVAERSSAPDFPCLNTRSAVRAKSAPVQTSNFFKDSDTNFESLGRSVLQEGPSAGLPFKTAAADPQLVSSMSRSRGGSKNRRSFAAYCRAVQAISMVPLVREAPSSTPAAGVEEHVVPKVARDGDDPRPVEAIPLAISRRTTATKADPSADWQNKLYTLLRGLWTGTTSLRMIILAKIVEAAARIFYKYGTAEKQSGHGWW